ncbi:MAG: (Fe-S)-binding protein [Thermodesulfobacteria bacterium]|nr:(Fe-S)-binding protein [Thermodesulfobacteriota bacterium]
MKILERCARCGKCLPACPSFQATLRESFSPRGRVALAREGLSASRTFSHCLLCGACEAVCPNELPLLEIFAQARSKTPNLLRPLYPALLKGLQLVSPRSLPGKGETILFLGCGGGLLYSRELAHFLRLFEALVGEISLLEGICCGLPYLAAGDQENFLKGARRIVALLEGKKTLLTLCASCLYTFRRFYPAFLKEGGLASRFEDALAYLLRRGADLFLPQRVFFQVPCHLRHLETEAWWREQKGLVFHEGCCGQAGMFGFRYPEEASLIAKPLKKAIFSSGASILTSSCTSCLLYLKKTFPRLDVCHVVSFLAKRPPGKNAP